MISMMRMTLLTAAVLLGAQAALAHDEATLDRMSAPNGGQLRAAGALHYELVLAPVGAKGAALPVSVYLTDHGGNKVPSAGASGTVTLLAQGQKTQVRLVPAGDNLLKGEGAYQPGAALKAIVSVTPKGQPAAQARFTPYAKPVGGHDHAGGHTH